MPVKVVVKLLQNFFLEGPEMTTSKIIVEVVGGPVDWLRATNKLQADFAICGCLPGCGSIMKDAFKVLRAGSNVSGTPTIFQN